MPTFDQASVAPASAEAASAPGLESSRALLARLIGGVWRELAALVDADMQERALHSEEPEAQRFLGGLRDKFAAHSGEIELSLPQHWRQEFDAALGERAATGAAGLEELRLVDLSDLDEDLALKAFGRRIEESCAETVYAVGRRVAVLNGKRRAGDIAAAAAPEVFGAAVRRSLAAADFSLAERIELLRCLTRRGELGFASLYREWNEHLIGLGVLPGMKHAYGPAEPAASPGAAAPAKKRVAGAELFGLLQGLVAPGAATAAQGQATTARSVDTAAALEALDRLQWAGPEAGDGLTADSLRRFRASEIGQSLGQLDAITVDIVAMLFDMIFQDEAIADPIKALIGRLQIPVLKVALADRAFFASRAHPARRLLEQISRAAVQLGRAAGREDPLYGKLALIIERLRQEFSYDAVVFDGLCSELEVFLAEQSRLADEQAAAGVPLAQAQERHLAALTAAGQALAPYVAEAPAAITELLGCEWRDLLARAHEDGDLGAWDAALATASDLVASVRIAPGSAGRKTLVELLPGLIRRIQQGFDRLDVDPERRLQLVDALFALHAALLAGDATAVERTSGAAPLDALVASEAARERVARLERGNWVEMSQADAPAQRYRVSWIGPARGVLLLTNPSLPRGVALSPQVLALKLDRGQARIVPSEPIFERAVERALRTLSEEQAAEISLDFT